MDSESRLLYDELAQAGASFQDAERARMWEERARKLGAAPDGLVEHVYRCLEIQRDHVLVDIGAGAGGFAVGVAARCRHVYAVDISEHMLKLARAKAATAHAGNITFMHAGFLTFEIEAGTCDHAVATAALHHLPDFWKMVAVRRIYRVLKDGGRLYLGDLAHSFDIDEYEKVFTRDLEEMRTRTGDEGLVEDAVTTIREEFGTFDWIMEGILTRAGFRVDEKQVRSQTWVNSVCTKTRDMGDSDEAP